MGWETSKAHDSKYGANDPRGSTHSDIQYRDDESGKVDHDAGKGYVSGDSRATSYLDSLSDPGNPTSDVPSPGGTHVPVSSD